MFGRTSQDGDTDKIQALPPGLARMLVYVSRWIWHDEHADTADRDGDDRDKPEYPWPAGELHEDGANDKPKN